jgi:uncharacterized coiled-coil protein SlyX
MTIDEVNAQFDNLQAAVNKAEADLTAFIQTLKDQIAAGVPITQAQLDALGSNIKALADGVAQFDINTTSPPSVPVVIPPEARAKKK